MSNKVFNIVIILTIAFIIICYTTSKELSKLPIMPDDYYVVDRADIISSEMQNKLENNLKLFNKTTGANLYIVTVDSLYGYNDKYYAQKIIENWGKKNYVILLFSKNDSRSVVINDLLNLRDDYNINYGAYVKSIGYEDAALKIYNNYIDLLCDKFKINNYYSINLLKDIKENKENYKLYGVTISTILMIVSLAFFIIEIT